MRQRKVRNLDEKVDALSAYLETDPRQLRGAWKGAFENDYPIYLEIGAGRGQFAMKKALLPENEESNFIAIEGQLSVAIRAMEKADELFKARGRRQLIVVSEFVNDIGEMFGDGELAGIYLNFSDPWPKERHSKRRLTYRERLKSYMKALAEGGFIEIKTDNDALFAFTLDEIRACGFEIAALSNDLHGDACSGTSETIANAAAVTTEYEDKFRAQGLPIHFVRLEK